MESRSVERSGRGYDLGLTGVQMVFRSLRL